LFPHDVLVAKGDELRRVGRAVAARRGELGLTRQELADEAGVDLKTIYNLESGTRWPIARTRASVAAALGWTADALDGIAAGYGTPSGLPAARPVPLHTPQPAAPPPPPGFVTDEIKEEARPFADEIWERLWMLAGNRAPDPTGDGQPPDPGGAALFGEGTHDQFAWDSAAPHRPLAKTWFLAVLRSRREAAGDQEQGTGAGLARAHP